MSSGLPRVQCPICQGSFTESQINPHVNSCLNKQETGDEGTSREGKRSCDTDHSVSNQTTKRAKIEETGKCSVRDSVSSDQGKDQKKTAWGVLMSPKKSSNQGLASSKTKSTSVKPGEKSKSFFSQKLAEEKDKCDKNPSDTDSYKKAVNMDKTDHKEDINSNKQAFSSLNSHSAEPKVFFGGTSKSSQKVAFAPLAEQMRPQTLQEYVGQENTVGRGKLLRSLLQSHEIPSMIFWGPPGCGKTTLAKIIAKRCKDSHDTRYVPLSATTANVAQVKEVVKVAKNEQKMFKRKTILFIDEIHRFNKLQQDTFLPHVEDGTIILIGATTENPSFQVNNALLSRCRVIVLEKLSVDSIQSILQKACQKLNIVIQTDINKSTESPQSQVFIEEKAVEFVAYMCDGDARSALNCLETSFKSARSKVNDANHPAKSAVITVDNVKEALQKSHVQYDRAGEEHYNCASALQKSIRGSDDSAAIYWLARMVEGGEDPLFIARRLVVCASEDIGLADPQALQLAVATFQACHQIGMPECAINLSHCVTYMARAPKSNESYKAYDRAKASIKSHEGPLPGVPLHLRNASTKLMKDLGYGAGYIYPHGHKGNKKITYLPDELVGTNFFPENDKDSKY